MEAFLPFIIPLILIPLSLYLISFLGKTNSRNTKNLPPGTKGWPIIGENMEFTFSGPEKFIKDRMQKYSPDIFKTSLLGEKMAILCGAQGNKFFFTNDNKLLTTWYPQSLAKPLVFPEYFESDQKEVWASQQRIFHHEILKPEALKQYIPIMDALAREHMDRDWKPNTTVKVFPLSKGYTFELACRLFLDLVDREEIKKLGDTFALVSKGMFSVPIDFPGMAYNGAMKGGKLMREKLLSIVKLRKRKFEENNEIEGRDILSKWLLYTDEDGKFLNEMEICNNIIGLLVASYESTSSAVTSVMNYLASLPHIYQEVLKEQMKIAKSKTANELLTWEDIEKMKYSWNVARESLRLTPSAQGGFREATTEFTYAGFTIPKGWKTFWTVNSSHKNPKYFSEPEKFDPSRFEGSGPAPYTFVPFGGGSRMCPGKEYARLEVLVFMYNVVTRFRLEKAIPDEKIVFYASPTPVYGLPMHLHPHVK